MIVEEFKKALYNNLVQEFGLNLSLSSDISYRILPRPHFHIKDSKFIVIKKKDLDEIGEVKDMKIFISQKNLFDRDNIYIKEVILSKEISFSTDKILILLKT